MPPLFVVLDGIDGTGKSTQCRLLAEWLRSQGHTVTECVEPGSTPIGDELRAILLGHRHGMDVRTRDCSGTVKAVVIEWELPAIALWAVFLTAGAGSSASSRK